MSNARMMASSLSYEMIDAIIFDIDGTLSDWETSIDRAFAKVAPSLPSANATEIASRFRAALRDYCYVLRDGVVVDRRYWMLLMDPVPPWRAAATGVTPDVAKEAAFRFREALEPVPYPDARPTLRELQGRYRLGVLTNGPQAEVTIERLGLTGYFESVLFPGEQNRKPLPEAFLMACRELDVKPASAAYVGDSITNDVEAATNAGLRAIWIDRHRDDYLAPASIPRIETLRHLSDAVRVVETTPPPTSIP